MCGYTKLYVDDVRPLPDEYDKEGCWQKSTTVWEAVTKLSLLEFEVVSLDHDLACFMGNKELTGYDIVMWLVERKIAGGYVPPKIIVHSANPVGVSNMMAMINRYLT